MITPKRNDKSRVSSVSGEKQLKSSLKNPTNETENDNLTTS